MVFFAEGYQVIHVEEIIELEHHLSVNSKETIDSGKNYQWLLKSLGNGLWETRNSQSAKASLHQLFTSCQKKKKVTYLEDRHSDLPLTKWSNLVSLIFAIWYMYFDMTWHVVHSITSKIFLSKMFSMNLSL